jgi:hypothetical protein
MKMKNNNVAGKVLISGFLTIGDLISTKEIKT